MKLAKNTMIWTNLITFVSDLDYRVTVKTGDDPRAGTDANVFLQMFGEEGQTSKFLLREEGDQSRFDRGRTDEFAIRTKDVGKVRMFLIFAPHFFSSLLYLEEVLL
jgi:hypothetical protein